MSVTDKDVMIPYDSWFVFGIVFFRWLSQGPSTWRCISSVHRSNGLTFGEPKGTARRWWHCLTGVCWPGLLRCRVVVTHVIWIHGRSLYDRWKYIGWVWIGNSLHIITFWVWDISQLFLNFPWWKRGKSTFGVSPYGAPPYPHHWNDKRTVLPESAVANSVWMQTVDQKPRRGILKFSSEKHVFCGRIRYSIHRKKIHKNSSQQLWTSNFWGNFWNLEKKT